MNLRKSLQLAAFAAVLAGMGSMGAEEAAAWPWPWVNPEIYNSGNQMTGIQFDPFTGRITVRTDRTRVRESYLDPNRGLVDAGSLRYVDEVQVDASGVQWRVQGWQWTSNGVPHGNLNRSRVRNTIIPGVDHQENDRVLYSAQVDANEMPGVSITEPRQPTRQPRRFNNPARAYNPF